MSGQSDWAGCAGCVRTFGAKSQTQSPGASAEGGASLAGEGGAASARGRRQVFVSLSWTAGGRSAAAVGTRPGSVARRTATDSAVTRIGNDGRMRIED